MTPAPTPRVRRARRAPMSEEPEKLAEGTLISHLLELRDRLLRALVAVGDRVRAVRVLLQRPVHLRLAAAARQAAAGQQSHRHRRDVARSPRPSSCRSSPRCMVAMPYVIYQLWAFVAPGLYRKRAALRGAAAGVLDPALLRRHRLRLLLRLPGDVPVLRQHDAQGRVDDDRHQQLPGFRAHHVLLLRARLRGAGGGGAAGGHGPGARREAARRTAATC